MLSAIRECEAQHFDFLGGVLFHEDFTLDKACIVPFDVVLRLSKYRKHTNSHVFELKDEVWAVRGVVDISAQVEAVLAQLDTATIIDEVLP